MHFSKTYSQLLLSLPPDLRESAIEYRQLKKLINQVVEELTSLGLSPQILQQVLEQSQAPQSVKAQAYTSAHDQILSSGSLSNAFLPRVTYELNTDSNELQPQLRLRTYDDRFLTVASVGDAAAESTLSNITGLPDESSSGFTPILSTSHEVESSPSHQPITLTGSYSEPREIIIPLPSDSAFIQTLIHAHQSLSERLTSFCDVFYANLGILSREISKTARPMSQTHPSFHAHSLHSNPITVRVRSPTGVLSFLSPKSDLYAWREVLQLYVDAEVFESTNEESRGERAIADAEERLAIFMQRLAERGLSTGSRMKLNESKHAMQLFLQLNASILNLYKFQFATTEATRKILKKHAKRTALPFTASLPTPFMIDPDSQLLSSVLVALPRTSTNSLARTLVQAVGETVLPIVPAVDDYSCIICINIAFKPIRLSCGHLFCVRCLVKMQKRSQANCPMCRAPCVLVADRSNVDWALLNFMKDWFPIESHKKLKANEAEVAKEEMQELGFSTDCIIQ